MIKPLHVIRFLLFLVRIPGTERYGFYEAEVFGTHTGNPVQKPKGGKFTMFPDGWSRRDVMMTVNKAYAKYLETGKTEIKLNSIMMNGARHYNGIYIKLRIDNGRVSTAYPVIK